MKLPKGLGNMKAMMEQAQEAMRKAQNMERELQLEEVELNKDGVNVKFNGVGELLALKIDKSLVDPEDVEALEDCVLLALREGYAKSVEIRQEKMQEVTGGLPNVPGLGM